MSWLFKSLRSNDPDQSSPPPQSPSTNRGVKDDLSVISGTIGRQLRGVANFLAPPPEKAQRSDSPPPPLTFSSSSSSPSQTLIGIRNDLAEIGGSLKTGLSKLTSNFVHFRQNDEEEEEEDAYVAGITGKVVNFVKEISTRPECWTDFPLQLGNEFGMSDAQREHASTVERIVPSLAALRSDLGEYVGDGKFWMVYFVLLIPRLSEPDAQILSTPLIVKTRNLLLQKLQNKTKMRVESAEISNTLESFQEGIKVSEMQKENISSGEEEVSQIVNTMNRFEFDDEGNAGRWSDDTDISTATSVDKQKKHESEEDVSFSDPEDEDNDLSSRSSTSIQRAQGIRAPSWSGSGDWVQLNETVETQGQVGPQKARQSNSRDKDSDVESTDWLKVDDFD